jgi:hypothetical protein
MFSVLSPLIDRAEAPTNLSIRGPRVGPEKPVGRPCAATVWHMLDISDEHAVGVRIIADQTHGRATWPTQRKLVGSIDAHSRSAIDSSGISVSQGGRSVDILNVPVGGIAISEKVEIVEECIR